MFSSIAQSATVTTGATQVFSTTGLSAGTSDVIIVNAGPSDIYVSGSSSAGTSGFPVPAVCPSPRKWRDERDSGRTGGWRAAVVRSRGGA